MNDNEEYIGTLISDETCEKLNFSKPETAKIFISRNGYHLILESCLYNELNGERIDWFANSSEEKKDLDYLIPLEKNFNTDQIKKKLNHFYFVFSIEQKDDSFYKYRAKNVNLIEKRKKEVGQFIPIPLFRTSRKNFFSAIKKNFNLVYTTTFDRQEKNSLNNFVSILEDNKLFLYGPIKSENRLNDHLQKIKNNKLLEIKIENYKNKDLILGEHTLFIDKNLLFEYSHSVDWTKEKDKFNIDLENLNLKIFPDDNLLHNTHNYYSARGMRSSDILKGKSNFEFLENQNELSNENKSMKQKVNPINERLKEKRQILDEPSPENLKENKIVLEENNKSNEIISIYRKNKSKNLEIETVMKKELTPSELEERILNNLVAHTQNNNFFYDKDDLTNFHIALKSGDFVILAGKSGTGKSKLTQMYAETLGAHFKLIPVKPSWNDDSDLVGYFDNTSNIYHSDEYSFVDFLIEAEENPDELFIACLDEMNLARVEYYFSKFLSKLQTSDRTIELFNKNLNSLNKVNPIIHIGDNIKFVGTINLDETTFNLSDKVLDRANVVSLDILDFTTDWVPEGLEEENITVSYDDFKSLLNNNEFDEQAVREFLWDLNKVLKEKNFEFGPRVLVEIENYLSNLTDGLTFAKGLDYQVKQRIITKLRGPEEAFLGLFEKINEVLDKYKNLSEFPLTRNELNNKRYELTIYGFTR